MPLLRLLQLCSPALPIGAFAYSHGLEQAQHQGTVADGPSAEQWIGGLVDHVWARWDVPVLARLYGSIAHGRDGETRRWCALLEASRESAELLAEDLHLGRSLADLMLHLGMPQSVREPEPFAAALARAAVHWGLSLRDAALAWLWTAVEHEVSAAVRLIPLGQSEGQRLLSRLAARIPAAIELGLSLADEEIGAFSPGLALASAQHETLYSRLFRS
jgi:urease accessory protein